MNTQNNIEVPSLIVTMSEENAKYALQEERARVRNIIVAELRKAGVLPDAISFRNLPTMYPIVELADLLALKLDGRDYFKQGTVESFTAYGTAIQSLGVKGFKKAALTTAITKAVVKPAQTSDNLLKHAVLQAVKDRMVDIEAYYLTKLRDVLDNPAQYLADNYASLAMLGAVNLDIPLFNAPFELPIDRINALLQAEKYRAQLEHFKEELVCNKATNFRVHETFLVCDGQPTDEQKTVITAKGFLMYPKDTAILQAEITAAMASQDFAAVVKLSQELVAMQNTVEIRKPLTE